ncbi:MAG: hypothetical protein GXP49_06335 [Deltaproteobacteria bacterium]|nr:hypothetical protein [Deltaproteobacteria bacterium]
MGKGKNREHDNSVNQLLKEHGVNTDPVAKALEMGCPVIAARKVLNDPNPSAVRRLEQLKAGEFDIALPKSCRERSVLEQAIERELPAIAEKPGVLALALLQNGEETCFAAPYRLDAMSRKFADLDALGAIAGRAVEAAMQLLQDRYGPLQLDAAWNFEFFLLNGKAMQVELRDTSSAGLAAALAFVHKAAGLDGKIAAMGRVDADGRVRGVEGVEKKLSALKREAPFVNKVYLPGSNRLLPGQEKDLGLELVYVDTVAEAIDDLIGDHGEKLFSRLDPPGAVKKAEEFEIMGMHGPAETLAIKALEAANELPDLGDYDRLKVQVLANATRAINLVHKGEAYQALEVFREMDSLIEKADTKLKNDVILPGTMTLATCQRASALIDIIEPQKAVETLEKIDDSYRSGGIFHVLAYWGTLSRAFCACDRLEDAERAARHQNETKIPGNLLYQRPRNLCNLADVFYKKARKGYQGAIDELKDVLERAKDYNSKIADDVQRQGNENYLKLYWCRLYSLTGEYEKALDLAGEIENSDSGFPAHLMFRYAGLALARAGRTDQGYKLLCMASDKVEEDIGPFVRLVLLTSAGEACLLALENEFSGGEYYGTMFLDAFMEYKPGLLKGDYSDLKTTVKKVLDLIPY